MSDNRSIGEKISSAYRPFFASKPVGPVDEIVNSLAKDIDRNISLHVAALQLRLTDIQEIAAELYQQIAKADNCIDYDSLGAHRVTLGRDIARIIIKYQKYKQVINIVDNANNREYKGTTG